MTALNASRFRYAFCPEGRYAMFNDSARGEPTIETFRVTSEKFGQIGYSGIETVAPLIGSDRPLEEYKAVLDELGLDFVGLHWALAKTTGLSLTDPCRFSMARTVKYLARLVRMTATLGGKVLVHGSPLQRTLLNHDQTQRVAFNTAAEIYRRVLKSVGNLGVYIALEPLARVETDFMTTVAEAVELAKRINHPNVSWVLDVKALHEKCQSAEAIAEVIRKYGPEAVHFHANDPNLGGPGCGDLDFQPIFQALADIGWDQVSERFGFKRWISVEVFDFKQNDLAQTARKSLEYMALLETKLSWLE